MPLQAEVGYTNLSEIVQLFTLSHICSFSFKYKLFITLKLKKEFYNPQVSLGRDTKGPGIAHSLEADAFISFLLQGAGWNHSETIRSFTVFSS